MAQKIKDFKQPKINLDNYLIISKEDEVESWFTLRDAIKQHLQKIIKDNPNNQELGKLIRSKYENRY